MTADIIAAFIGAAAGIITALLANAASRRKNNADASAAISEAAERLIAPLNKRIDEQEKKITDQDTEIRGLKKLVFQYVGGVRILIKQIRCLGHEPEWKPPDEPDTIFETQSPS